MVDGHITQDEDGYKRFWLGKKPKQVECEGEKVWWNDQLGLTSIRYTGNLEVLPNEPLPIYLSCYSIEQTVLLKDEIIKLRIELEEVKKRDLDRDLQICQMQTLGGSTKNEIKYTEKQLKSLVEVATEAVLQGWLLDDTQQEFEQALEPFIKHLGE